MDFRWGFSELLMGLCKWWEVGVIKLFVMEPGTARFFSMNGIDRSSGNSSVCVSQFCPQFLDERKHFSL